MKRSIISTGIIAALLLLFTVPAKSTAQTTADTYIEKATHRLAKENKVTVATSDGMEQLIILGQGALRLSARELELQVLQAEKKNRPNQPELKIGHRLTITYRCF